MEFEKVKAGFYSNYEKLDRGFSRETINEIDKAFRTIEILADDIADIEKKGNK